MGCGPHLDEGTDARIRVTPSRQLAFSRVEVGETRTLPFVVSSVGRDALRLERITWTGSEAVSVVVDETLPRDIPNAGSFPVSVAFAPTDAQPAPNGTIRIFSNDSDTPVYSLDVTAQQLAAQIHVVPSAEEKLIFGQTDIGRTTVKSVVVTNVGDLPLTISEVRLVADTSVFSVTGVSSLPATLAARASQAMKLSVEFAPKNLGKIEGSLVFISDDPLHSTYTLPIVANSDTPCLRIAPSLVEFSPAVSVGTVSERTVELESCSDVPLVVNDVRIISGSDVFSAKSAPSNVELAKGEKTSVVIQYSPQNVGTHTGKFVVLNNDPLQPNAEISVLGVASENQCPKASVRARVSSSSTWAKTLDVAPLDTILLDGSESSDPESSQLKYYWSIADNGAPRDSVSAIASDGASASFFVDLAGDYKLCLNVEDFEGMMSCNTDCVTLHAVPRETIHVQLVWRVPNHEPTPGDGADLDLHFLTLPEGKWGDTGVAQLNNGTDVYWENLSPVWQNTVPAEMPSLDIDSKDGTKPENVNLDKPTACRWYAIGVHYYQDNALGAAYATVRVYIDGKMRFEKANVSLAQTAAFKQFGWLFWDGKNGYFYESSFEASEDTAWIGMTPAVPTDVLERAKSSSPKCFETPDE